MVRWTGLSLESGVAKGGVPLEISHRQTKEALHLVCLVFQLFGTSPSKPTRLDRLGDRLERPGPQSSSLPPNQPRSSALRTSRTVGDRGRGRLDRAPLGLVPLGGNPGETAGISSNSKQRACSIHKPLVVQMS